MSLSFDGLQQVAAKKIAYFHTDDHPDGKGSMRQRLEDEIADVLAIVTFIKSEFGLDGDRIEQRIKSKIDLYRIWHDEN